MALLGPLFAPRFVTCGASQLDHDASPLDRDGDQDKPRTHHSLGLAGPNIPSCGATVMRCRAVSGSKEFPMFKIVGGTDVGDKPLLPVWEDAESGVDRVLKAAIGTAASRVVVVMLHPNGAIDIRFSGASSEEAIGIIHRAANAIAEAENAMAPAAESDDDGA